MKNLISLNSFRLNVKIMNLFFFICFMPVIASILDSKFILSLSLYSTVVFISLIYVYLLFKVVMVRQRIALFDISIFLVILITFIQYFLKAKYYISIQNQRNTLYIISLIILMYIAQKIKLEMKTLIFVIYLMILITLISLTVSFNPNSFIGATLYLNFKNPNVTGYCLMVVATCLIIGIESVTKLWKKRLLIYLIIDIALLILTKARTPLFSVVLLIIISFIPRNKYYINKAVPYIVTLLPLLAVIYFLVTDTTANNSILTILSVNGKHGLSGRENVWVELTLRLFTDTKSFVFGISQWPQELSGISNAHNAYLHIMVNFGVPFFVVFVCLLRIMLSRVAVCVKTKSDYLTFFSFVIILINASFESHFADGIIGLSAISIMILALPLSNKDKSSFDYKCSYRKNANK